MLTKYLKLDYIIYSNITKQDIDKFIKFENFIKNMKKFKKENKIPNDFGWEKNI